MVSLTPNMRPETGMSRNMDIFDLDLNSAAEDGAAMTVVHPTTGEDLTYVSSNGETRPIRIFLKGNDSAAFRNRMDFHMRKNGRNDRKQMSLAEMQDQSADLLASVTTGWEGVTWNIDGVKADLECTRENAKMLYKERPWLRKQVDEFVAEPENFFKINSNS